MKAVRYSYNFKQKLVEGFVLLFEKKKMISKIAEQSIDEAAFRLLNESFLKEIIPQIGTRIKILNHIALVSMIFS